MTVAADLQLQHAPRRRLFLRISGLQPALWEHVDETLTCIWGSFTWGAPEAIWGLDTGGLRCLRAPEQEWSQGLNLGTMEVAPSSMMIELDDIEDPADPGKSYFGKLFAPARYLSGARTVIDSSTIIADVLADATSIPVQNTSAFPAAGEAHIGQECFSYASKSGGGSPSLDGCVRGLYPAVDVTTPWGATYRRPLVDSNGNGIDVDGWRTVSVYPYTIVGRMVALYVTTWDMATGCWNPESSAELVWVGRITGSVRYSPTRAAWQLGCESIAKDFDRTVGGEPQAVDLRRINLTGSAGRKFRCIETGRIRHSGFVFPVEGVDVAGGVFTVPVGFYTADDLLDTIIGLLNNRAGWTNYTPAYPGRLSFGKTTVDGQKTLTVINQFADGDRGFALIPYDESSTPGAYGPPCHAWIALGYDLTGGQRRTVIVKEGTGGYKQEELFSPESKPFLAYHPLNALCNGGQLGVDLGPGTLWADQGDWGAGHPRACVSVTGARPDGSGDGESKAVYVAAYAEIGIDTSGTSPTAVLELIESPPFYPYVGYIGQRAGENKIKVEQRYIPAYELWGGRERGPFEILLDSLLSTGTPGYNGAYDVLPTGTGIAFPESLVDAQSFLDADASLGASLLAARKEYVIAPGSPWSTLLHRECQLFGYFLAWDRGKYRLRSGRSEAFSSWTLTLGESTRAADREWATPESSAETVVNVWHYKLDYDLSEKKYRREITIRDSESCEGLALTKAVELEHPGIYFDPGAEADALLDLIRTQLLSKQQTLRFPQQLVDVTLAPPYAGRAAIGDVVAYESSRHPDPFGSGSMTTSCLAQVIDLAKSFRRWTAKAKLMLCARQVVCPWSPSAVVDFSASNGGWDAANYRLTLAARTYGEATDSPDGAAFQAGDLITLIEMAPFDDYAAQEWGPLTVAKAFEADGAGLLTLSAVTLAGWPGGGTGGKEFAITACDYSNAPVLQRARGTWQADARDRTFAGGDAAQRWG